MDFIKIEEVIKRLQELYPEAVITEEVVAKNNGLSRHGIGFKTNEQERFTKIIYIDEFSDDLSVDEVVKGIIDVINNSNASAELFDNIQNFEDVKSHLTVELINKESNAAVLNELIYSNLLDLALIPVLFYTLPDKTRATVKINKKFAESWGVSEKCVMEAAMKNMIDERANIMNFPGVFERLGFQGMEEFPSIPFYILTNQSFYMGAAKMADEAVLEDICITLESDLIIIPSSIHECIVIPTNMLSEENPLTPEEANGLITSVNLSSVAADEVLSNHAYIYKNGEGLAIWE